MPLIIDIILGILTIFGAFGGISLTYHLVIKEFRKRKRSQQFFGNSKETYIALGSGPTPALIRRSDALVLSYLKRNLPNAMLPDSFDFPPKNVNLHALVSQKPILLVGSPRHNSFVDELQKVVDTPFQFVSITPELPPDTATLCIQENIGLQYDGSADRILGEVERNEPPKFSDIEYGYAIVLVGSTELMSGKLQRIIWIGGIHGTGTLGAGKWLVENVNNYEWDKLGNVCFLIRVSNKTNFGLNPQTDENFEKFENVTPEVIRGPIQWQFRNASQKQTGILFDMGNVLLPFNRRQFEYNLKSFFNIDLNDTSKNNIEEWRIELESGNMSKQNFVTNLKNELELPDTQENLIKLAWCDIFWRNEQLIAFLEKLSSHRKDIKLILFSNTDVMRLEYALHNLGLNKLFDPNHIVASCDSDVNPKGGDLSMLHKALKILTEEFETDDFQIIFVDDVRNYIRDSRKGNLDIQGIHYRTLPKLIFDLRKYGIYLPMH